MTARPEDDPEWGGRILLDHIPVLSSWYSLEYNGDIPRETDPLIEHSDFPGRQPGWFMIRPIVFGHVTSLVVNRMYAPDQGGGRELIYYSDTWSHPSREYACEIARQVAQGDRHSYRWRRAQGQGEGRSEAEWMRTHPSHVAVTRIGDADNPDRNVFLMFGPESYSYPSKSARTRYRVGELRIW